MFEPKILTKFELPKLVDTNLSELEPVIAEKVEAANSLVVTNSEEEVVAADADATNLTKMAERVKRFRIDFVAWWKAPLEKVESTCKSYEKRLTEAAKSLRDKTAEVKEMWNEQKKERLMREFLDALEARFDEQSGVRDFPHWLKWFAERTDPKTKGNWLNRTTRQSTIDSEIGDELTRVENDLATLSIQTEGSPAKSTVAVNAYREDCLLEDALRALYRYAKEQEDIRQAEEAAKSAPERASGAFEDAGKGITPPNAPNAPEGGFRVAMSEPIDLLTFRLSVTGTRQALIGLKDYAKANGIKIVNLDRVVKAQ